MNKLKEVLKQVQEKEFWKSKNFWTNIVSIILMVLASFGIDVPEEAALEVIDNIFPYSQIGFIGALINIGNIVWHIVKGGQPKSKLVEENIALRQQLLAANEEDLEAAMSNVKA